MKSHVSKVKFSQPKSFSEEELRNERNFFDYLKKLRYFAKKYCVIIAANNTPWGEAFTPDLTREVMSIGLKVDLYQKFRCPYIAVIDGGDLLCEKLETNTKNVLKVNMELDTNDKLEIISGGFDSVEANTGIIKINGTDYSPNLIGLNFVVYDKSSKKVIDAVSFNTYSTFYPYRLTDNVKLLERIVKNHPGVTVVEYNLPKLPATGLTMYEYFLKKNKIQGWSHIIPNLKTHLFEISRHYDDETVIEVFQIPNSYVDNIGARRFEDIHGKHLNIEGGHRITCYQPVPDGDEIYIYIYGNCIAFGAGASDEHTIASNLQKMFNELAPEFKVIVQNYGFYLEGSDMSLEQKFNTLNSLPLKPGDIILDFASHNNLPSSELDIPKIDMLNAAREPRNYEVFLDASDHLNPNGMKLAAEKLYEGLMKQGILDKARELAAEHGNSAHTVSNDLNFDQNTNEQLAEYKRFLTDFYHANLNQPTGAVVMNCNPFTLGHRYLIDKALEQCSFLVLFLVEEDKSEFPFDERLKLVGEGTKDIPNLAIIPSGKFVLSSLTFSEYFNKSEMQDRVIDTSLDVNVFAREIAPCLNITKRFAGEEPLDNVTRQYNETMRRILPEYGIEFVEIPRIELDSKPISASRVRELAKSGNFSELRELVPQTTLDYLVTLDFFVKKYKLQN